MPHFTTLRGLVLTAESQEAADCIQSFENNLLDLTQGLDNIPADSEQFPETAMVQACAATYFLYAQETAALSQANAYLAKAEALAHTCTRREQNYIQAIRHFHQNQYEAALALLEAQTLEWPADLLAAKVAEFLYYCLGQHYNGQRFLCHMQRLETACSDSAGYWAMRSFASELCADYKLAGEQATRSLTLNPTQPWAHHTLAHIQSRQGSNHNIATMESHLPAWRLANRGIHSHNTWHLALLYLDQLDIPRVHQLLKSDLWGITPDTVFEQLDTIALLWRLDLCDQPADDALWSEVAQHAAQHAGQCLIPFIEGHYAYALARAGDADRASHSVKRAQERAHQQDHEARHIWAPVGADFVAACAALGAGNPTQALELLDPISQDIPRVGGSDAQDDLFRQAHITALRQSGQASQARQTWNHYYPNKNRTPYDHKLV